jgi:TetR/AcrR family transcriptional regulator, cholesterol catabolism regulator
VRKYSSSDFIKYASESVLLDKPKAVKPSKSEMRRAEILEHAQRLFESKDYPETTLDDISRAVGIKREGLYYYFKNRRDILHALVVPILKDLNQSIEKIASSEGSPPAKFYAAIRNHLFYDMDSLGMVVLTGHGDDLNEGKDKDQHLRPYYKSYETAWAKIIDEGKTSGLFAKDVESRIITYAVLGMCNWMFRWFDPSKAISLDQIAKTFFTLTTNGLIKSKTDLKRVQKETKRLLEDLQLM